MKIKILLLLLQFTISAAAVTMSSNMQIALDHMGQGNVQVAVDMIRKNAATNDLLSQFYLAKCYENAIGVPENKEEAFRMYRRAAERGLPAAMKELARFYENGIVVQYNPDRAAEWMLRYERKNVKEQLPDILGIYKQGLALKNSSGVSQNNPLQNNVISQNDVAETTYPIISQPRETESEISHNESIYLSTHQTQVSVPEIQVVQSDVDIDIPETDSSSDHLFAFIFANEDYQDVANVSNAINDGGAIANYCEKTLGLPKTNIHLIKNATLNNLRRELNLMKQIANVYKEEAAFIIYYAGHGIPDEDSRNAYLMPVDGFVNDLSTCLSLSDFYDTVGKLPVKRNIIFLDACFSGSTRNNDMLTSARGVVISPKESKPSGNTLVISSSSGNETSYSYDDKKHGLFTYFLLKKIKETSGNLSIGSLVDYIKDNVSKKSIVVNGKSQTPTVNISQNIDPEWRQWQLK